MRGGAAVFYFCCDERRRNEIARRNDLNGVEFLEVLDTPDQAPEDRQRTLFVHFIHDPTGLAVARENVSVEGGERVRDVRVSSAQTAVDPRSGSTDPVLVVVVDTPGDHSTYTLRLEPTAGSPLPGLDPVLRAVDFSFKVNCATKFDPLRTRECAPEPRTEPALDYLARDYPSLRQLILDRLAVLIPDWQERNPADVGMVLVELLAYIGDQLSYRQDAVTTEGYLGTCRLRASARRHARLVDYFMHDGCNARAWVQVRLGDGTPPFELHEATFYSAVPGLAPRIEPGSREHDRARNSGATAFRLLAPARLAPEHNEIRFYTWGARQCCLPMGAVRATLRGDLRNLEVGMVLVFEEVRNPRTGNPADADLSHRHAVRLTEVEYRTDPVGGSFDDSPTDDPVEVTEVRWSAADALPFALCISAETAEEFGSAFVADVSVARGNIVLADHGAEVEEELGVVPEASVRQVLARPREEEADDGRCVPDRMVMAPTRFRPVLRGGPLTQAVPFDVSHPPESARDALRFRAMDAVPAIRLRDGTTEPWTVRLDLLSSRPSDKHFVVEVEDDGRGRVRFGDGTHGARPVEGSTFVARYRVGNGKAGNVGSDTLVHVVSGEDGIASVNNPLPAVGGVDMESIEEARQYAPVAFRPQTLHGGGHPDGRSLSRAVTPADYAAVTETNAAVQRAAASFRWTGSWRTVSVTVDRLGGGPVDAPFEESLRAYLEKYRLAGHDLEIEPPRPVALDIAMSVRVKEGYFASQVRRALLEVFSNRTLADGRRGVFHPDNLTFGQTIFVSPLYAAAQAVDGVESVDITTFQRRDRPGTTARDDGRLVLGRLEIARLDNDPNFPERGVLEVALEGGR
jgi:hypothetical protein